MSITEILNSAPYFSDFDPTKNYTQVLFKPGYAVQTRELIELQTIIQNQVENFADHVFKNGSKVLGGNITRKSVDYIKLNPSYNGVDVDLSVWLGKRINEQKNGTPTGMSAVVVAYANQTDSDPATLYVEYDSSLPNKTFSINHDLFIDGQTTGATIIDNAAFTGKALFVGVESGVYYIEGRFVKVEAQSILASKYNSTPSGVAGFEYREIIVTAEDDYNLRDRAQDAPNYNAPGADRFKMECGLRFYSDDETTPDNFISIIEFDEGLVKNEEVYSQYSEFAKELARRTFDESGNYTVRPFELSVKNHVGVRAKTITHAGGALAHQAHVVSAKPHGLSVDEICVVSGCEGLDAEIYNGDYKVDEVINEYEFKYSLGSVPTANAYGESIIIQRENQYTSEMGSGKAYVEGFEIEKSSFEHISVPKARSTKVIDNYATSVVYGSYLIVKDVNGIFDDTNLVTIDLLNNSNKIGTAKLRNFSLHSGIPGTPEATYKLHLYDFRFTGSQSIKNVNSVSRGNSNATVSSLSITSTKEVQTRQTEVLSEDDKEIVTESDDLIFAEDVKNVVDVNITRLLQTDSNSLIFPVPERRVKTLAPGGKHDTSFITKRKFEALVSGTSIASFNLTDNDFFVGPLNSDFANSDIAKINYSFVDKSSGSILTPSELRISTSGQEVSAKFSGSGFVVQMISSVQKTKTKEKSKTSVDETITISHLTNIDEYGLNFIDVYQIVDITHNNTSYKDYFTLDDGQRDNFYDYASVKKNKTLPLGDNVSLTVKVKRFEHTGEGYFSVDSYTGIDYEDIPSYTDTKGTIYSLSDVLDFRPSTKNQNEHEGNLIPIPNSLITADFEFYLPRRDRIVLDKNGNFQVVLGEPSLNPQYPNIPDSSMLLYEVTIPPYTADPTNDIEIKFVENKRYTMHDIGKLDRRINRVEYYTALSLLEMNTKQTDVIDENGNNRFKNGFLVDNFTGHKIGDVRHPDYSCSMDFEKRELRPSFVSDNIKLKYSSQSSSSVNQIGNENSGHLVTLPYTEKLYLAHPNATKAESVNPYLVVRREGTLKCNPPSDDWVDTTRKPAVRVNLLGNEDAWQHMARAINAGARAGGFGTRWDDWRTVWQGVTASSSESIFWRDRSNNGNNTTTITTTTTTTNQERDGEQTVVNFGSATRSLGDKIVDLNISHFMRPISIDISGSNLRPNTDLHVFIDDVKVNANTVPLDPTFNAQREGIIRTDEFGEVRGKISVPAGRFRTGERTITIIDETNNILDNATTYAKYVFAASGMIQTKEETIVSTRQPVLSTQAVTDTRVLRDVTTSSVTVFEPTEFNRPDNGKDPFAQTIMFNSKRHPYGLFLSSVGLFFKKKPSTNHPISVHLRPVINGFPHSSKIIPLTEASIKPDDVKIPTKTDDIEEIRKAETVFTFDAPVFLEPKREYALVIISDSSEYETYISEMGQPILGTNKIASQQPSLGSLFKSQNARTWTPAQTEDIMMNLYRCEFNKNVQATVVYDPEYEQTLKADTFMHNIEALNFEPVTEIKHSMKIKDFKSKQMPQEWSHLITGRNIHFDSQKLVDDSDSLKIRTVISTTRDDVAPVIDLSRNSVILVENWIDNFGIDADGFEIVSGGSGYTNATISLSEGADSLVEPVIENGSITGVNVIAEGQGFYNLPSVTISGDGSGAEIKYTKNEKTKILGNAKAKYITKKVTLSDDWESDYATVTFDAYKPLGTGFRVYYKAIAAEDQKPFDDLPWVEMKASTDKPLISNNSNEYLEHNFVPENNSLAYTRDGINYSKIKTMAVKIVLTSTNTSIVPKAKDLRVIWATP